MNKILKTLSALTIASFATTFTACGEDTTAGVTEEANGLALNSSDSEDEELSSSSKKQEKSSSSKKDKVSSSSEKEERSSSSEKGDQSSSSEKVESSSSSVKEEPAKFSGKVSGVSQKGPFLVGSTVTLYELDGTSFDLSGRSFVNKIKNDKGEFEVSFKDLSSNYALFIADGYYRNEVSGKKSTSPIKLNALSDLADRNTVNVNLLTHLEFDRVKYLTMSKGVEYGEAKAQAEKEILEAFGISFKEGASAEDLSIFGSTENDGALLALSVLMQGTSAEGAFSERLSLVAQDLEEDGSIDDKQMLADIADEVALMDLGKVRKNIEGWKLSTTVPEFENFVVTYWTTNYGIGACTKEEIAKAAENTNELSKNYEKLYVCEESGWRLMTADEVGFGTCAATEDGKRFEKSRICDGGKWRSMTADESMGACTEEKMGETAVEGNELSKNFEKKHVCDKDGWRVVTEDEEKYGLCSAKENGTHFEKYRVCDGGKWRSLTADESMGACTEEKIGTTAVEGNVLSSNYEKTHVCDKDGWRVVTALEENLGLCTIANDHQGLTTRTSSGTYNVCFSSAWKSVNEFIYDSLTLVCEKDGDLVQSELSGAYYICKNGKIAAPTFGDLSMDKEFTADIWNGATDSKVKFGEDEFEISMYVESPLFQGYIYNSKGDEQTIGSGGLLNFPVYDANGVSSTLEDKGLKYSYQLKAQYNASYYEYISALFEVNEEGMDVTDWEGVCLVYASAVPLHYYIYGRESNGGLLNNHFVVPASMNLTVANIKWEDFIGFSEAIKYEEIVKRLLFMSVDVDRNETTNATLPEKGSVYIAGIGKYNGCSVK